MISVILPIYNSEKYLKKCIDSIKNQTYKDLEIILVNDGSTDNSPKICDEYAKIDKRIKVIHQKNGGQATARNAGLDASKGEYIAFVDSDDYIEKDMYELLLSMIEESHSDIAICGHKEVFEDESISSVEIFEKEMLDTEALWQEIFGNLNNAVWNKLFKKELIGELRFPVGMIHGEDLIFNLNYLLNCKSGIKNNTAKYYYVQRTGSVTNSGFSEKKLTEIATKDLAFEIVKKHHPQQIYNAQKYCFRARMNVLRAIFRSGLEDKYINEVNDFIKYVNSSFNDVKNSISAKEKIEFILLNKCHFIYKISSKMV